MPQSKTRKKPQKPVAPKPTGPVQRLRRVTEECINMVRDLQPLLTEEEHLELRAGALGMLITYSVLTGNPDPRTMTSIERSNHE